MLEDVKTALRLGDGISLLEVEVQDLIDAARDELKLAGVSEEKADSNEDPLIRRAIITYAKANFGYDNPDAERFQRSFESLKQHLSLAEDYRG